MSYVAFEGVQTYAYNMWMVYLHYCILRWVNFNSKGQYKQYSIEASKLFEDVMEG